jgi:hypothetical protein
MKFHYLFLTACIFMTQVVSAATDYDRALANFDNGVAPSVDAMTGWWTGRCYFKGHSGEETTVGFVLAFPPKNSGLTDTRIMAGRAYGDHMANYFDTLNSSTEKMVTGWTDYEWRYGVPYAIDRGSWHRQTVQPAKGSSPEIIFDNLLRFGNGRYAYKFVVDGEIDLACITTKRIR